MFFVSVRFNQLVFFVAICFEYLSRADLDLLLSQRSECCCWRWADGG